MLKRFWSKIKRCLKAIYNFELHVRLDDGL
jgi:hypothetical protein